MNYAVIDIGSNTVRMNIYQYNHKLILLFSKKRMVGLESFIINGKLSEMGEKKLIDILKLFKKLLSYMPVDDVYIFATAALRKTTNNKDVIKNVKAATNFQIDLVSERDEAKLGFGGITRLKVVEDAISVDIGGGSTEITRIEKGEITQIYNLDKGSLSLWNTFVKQVIPTPGELKNMNDFIKEKIGEFKLQEEQIPELIGIGGTIRATGRLIRELDNLNTRKLFTIKRLNKLYDSLSTKDPKTMRGIVKAIPERVHTIIPGIVILKNIADTFQSINVSVSDYGVREGYFFDKIQR